MSKENLSSRKRTLPPTPHQSPPYNDFGGITIRGFGGEIPHQGSSIQLTAEVILTGLRGLLGNRAV